ncbi:hypothetical protein IGJ02_003017 [Enterococcus sp. DIV0724b]|uniref:hypothetical protein n=1 Tax=Enterococcus sp. DIV0724b TaxID=2774694 RepID=UPI003D2FE9E3
MSRFWKMNLFLFSNIPIFFMVIIKKIDIFDKDGKLLENFITLNNILVLCTASLLFMSILTFFCFKKKINQKANNHIPIKNLKTLNISYLSTVASYLLPTFSLDIDGVRGILIFIMTFLLTMYLFNKSGDYYSSLMFYVMKFNIYSTEIEENGVTKEIILLSKNPINELEGKKIKVRYFEENENIQFVSRVLIEKGVE